MKVLAVDFGTSNTVAAVAVDSGAPRLLTIDGSPLVPSSVFLTDEGPLAVGRDADRQARLDPARYEPNPKRRIDDGEILLGTEVVPVRDAVAAVLGRVASEVRRQFANQNPDQVRLTHPARWGQARKDVLVAAAEVAGLGTNPILVPEPVAAATHFATLSGTDLSEGSALAVYDLGGGTFDVAIVQRRKDSYDVIAEAGLPDLGGLDFDHAVLEHIGVGQEHTDPAAWSQLVRPTDSASRRLQRALAVDIRDGKESLSRHPHTDIALPPPFTDVHLTRSEFEELIRPNLARSVELLAVTIGNAGFDPKDLVGVYLVGGSSRIPLVAQLIQRGLGITPTTLDQPESTVATGALYLPVGKGDPAATGPVAPITLPPALTGPGTGPGTGSQPAVGPNSDRTVLVSPYGTIPQPTQSPATNPPSRPQTGPQPPQSGQQLRPAQPLPQVRPTARPPGAPVRPVIRQLPPVRPGTGGQQPRQGAPGAGRPNPGMGSRPPAQQSRQPAGPARPAQARPGQNTGSRPAQPPRAPASTNVPAAARNFAASGPRPAPPQVSKMPIVYAALIAGAVVLIAILIAALA